MLLCFYVSSHIYVIRRDNSVVLDTIKDITFLIKLQWLPFKWLTPFYGQIVRISNKTFEGVGCATGGTKREVG